MESKTVKWKSSRVDQTVLASLRNVQIELMQLCLEDIETFEYDVPDILKSKKIRYKNHIVPGNVPGLPGNISIGATAVLLASWGEFPVPQEILDYVKDAYENNRIKESSLPSSEEMFERGRNIVSSFMNKGIPYYSAIAICGACWVECKWNVHVANKLEKDDGGVGGTGGWPGCGEGLFGLTFWSQKQKIISAMTLPGIPSDTTKDDYKDASAKHLCDLDEETWIDILAKYLEICVPKHKDILCNEETPKDDEERTKVICSSYLFKAAGARDATFDNAKLTAESYMKTHTAQSKNPKYQAYDGFALQVLISIMLDKYLHGEDVDLDGILIDVTFDEAMKSGNSMNSMSTFFNKWGLFPGSPSKEYEETRDLTLTEDGKDKDIELRVFRGNEFTHGGMNAAYGKLYVNGSYFCDTAERNLVKAGTYDVLWRKDQGCTVAGRNDWMKNGLSGNIMYRFATYSNGVVPLVKVRDRSGIRIHEGTGVSWSKGCLVVGKMNNDNTGFSSTWNEWKMLYDFCRECRSCKITYIDSMKTKLSKNKDKIKEIKQKA